jgi:hypothetical protein
LVEGDMKRGEAVRRVTGGSSVSKVYQTVYDASKNRAEDLKELLASDIAQPGSLPPELSNPAWDFEDLG